MDRTANVLCSGAPPPGGAASLRRVAMPDAHRPRANRFGGGERRGFVDPRRAERSAAATGVVAGVAPGSTPMPSLRAGVDAVWDAVGENGKNRAAPSSSGAASAHGPAGARLPITTMVSSWTTGFAFPLASTPTRDPAAASDRTTVAATAKIAAQALRRLIMVGSRGGSTMDFRSQL
jgi:hypothetical protein